MDSGKLKDIEKNQNEHKNIWYYDFESWPNNTIYHTQTTVGLQNFETFIKKYNSAEGDVIITKIFNCKDNIPACILTSYPVEEDKKTIFYTLPDPKDGKEFLVTKSKAMGIPFEDYSIDLEKNRHIGPTRYPLSLAVDFLIESRYVTPFKGSLNDIRIAIYHENNIMRQLEKKERFSVIKPMKKSYDTIKLTNF